MSNSLMTIALHRIKEKHNITTKMWAQMSGVPESTIYRFLNSSVNIPNFPAVCAMLKCLGESIDVFYDRLDAKIDTPADALGLDVTIVDAIDDIHVDAPEARAEIQERIIRQAEEIQTQQILIRERDAYIELLNAKLKTAEQIMEVKDNAIANLEYMCQRRLSSVHEKHQTHDDIKVI